MVESSVVPLSSSSSFASPLPKRQASLMRLLQSDGELFGDDEPHEDDLVLWKVRPVFRLHEKTPKAIEVKYMSIRFDRQTLYAASLYNTNEAANHCLA